MNLKTKLKAVLSGAVLFSAMSTMATDLTVTNTDFATDTAWTKGGTATISAGVATLPDASSYVEQTLGDNYAAEKFIL